MDYSYMSVTGVKATYVFGYLNKIKYYLHDRGLRTAFLRFALLKMSRLMPLPVRLPPCRREADGTWSGFQPRSFLTAPYARRDSDRKCGWTAKARPFESRQDVNQGRQTHSCEEASVFIFCRRFISQYHIQFL